MRLIDGFNKLIGKIPPREELEQTVIFFSERLRIVQQGMCPDIINRGKTPFDTKSEVGINYIKQHERLHGEAKERLEFFYPPAPVTESKNVSAQPKDTLQIPHQEPL